jgi:hypothetical protein
MIYSDAEQKEQILCPELSSSYHYERFNGKLLFPTVATSIIGFQRSRSKIAIPWTSWSFIQLVPITASTKGIFPVGAICAS